MNFLNHLTGATRVIAIVGDPIAQVKSPAGVTQALRERGRDAVVVPFHVATPDLPTFLAGVTAAKNFDGLIVTVPHKFDVTRVCTATTDRAAFLGAVNILRRDAQGGWFGDQVDGIGFVEAARAAGCKPEGLRARHGGKVTVGSADPAGYDVVVNATPSGMRDGDPLPFDVSHLSRSAFVGDVITAPAVTPLIEAARRIGCHTQVGVGMFAAVCERMVDFLVADGPLADRG